MANQCPSLRRQTLINSLNLAANPSVASNNFLSDQITSPPIQVNEAKPLINNNQVIRTSSTPTKISQNQNTNQTRDSTIRSTESESKNSLKLRNYILFEPQTINETFGTALNTLTNQVFYWKKFDRRDYMKKMETYFIMESSERILGFKEIIFDSANFAAPTQFVYVIFNQFFGDLHSYMKEKKRLDETEAKHIFHQCVQAVNDCHQNGIIVRDIKLKKFVFIDSEKTKIALANPEDCLILDEDAEDDLIKSQQGCPAYVSPEVLNTNLAKYSGKLSDSWSLGIVLFTLLLGRYPFHHHTITTMFAKIARGKYQIPPSSGLSQDAKILLRSLIRLQPSERLLPSEILASNWMKQNTMNMDLKLQQNKFKNLNSACQYLSHLSSTTSTNILVGNNGGGGRAIYHKPLGASRSTPGGMLQRGQKKAVTKVNESEADKDRMVPEFKVPEIKGENKSVNEIF